MLTYSIEVFCWIALLLPILIAEPYNASLCTDIVIGELHYYINADSNSKNIYQNLNNDVLVYNLCKSVEVYCPELNAVVTASLVSIDKNTNACKTYNQAEVRLLDSTNISSGISVIYSSLSGDNQTVILNYTCNGSVGCPSVESGNLWQYFEKGLLAYTIVIQVIGIILMIFGVYIYRGSIVLIGWGTSILILLIIQSFFVFFKGVPDSTIQNVIILTLICSFFVGYILGYFPKAGVFCLGLWIGGLIALTLNNIAFYYIKSNPPNLVLYIVAPILCVSFGIIILYIRRAFITFASSLIGSYLSLRALSWYLGAFPNQFQLSKKYHLGLSPPVPWQFYLYVIALLILTASSSALQTWLFKKKMSRANEQTDLQKHIDQMQSKLRKQRVGMIQFQNMFNNAAKQSRVLSKQNDNRKYENTSIQQDLQSNQESQNMSLPDYKSSQNGEKEQNQLNENLIKGKKR